MTGQEYLALNCVNEYMLKHGYITEQEYEKIKKDIERADV